MFCYDGPLQVDGEGNFYGTVINDRVFARYNSIAEEIVVAIRVEKTTQPNEKSRIKTASVTVCEIPNLSSLSGQVTKSSALKKLRTLAKGVDFLIIRLPSFIGNECIRIADELNIPYIVEMVGCPWDSLWNYSFKGKLVAPAMFLCTRNSVRKASYVIYVTNHFLQSRYPTDGLSVSCSNVELPSGLPLNERKIERYCSCLSGETLVLGTSAAVDVPYKGQDCVVRALPLLLEAGVDVRYELAGGGSPERLARLAEELGVRDRVCFKGLLPHQDVFSWLDDVDIYIQPSKQEGLPRALLEAMNMSCFCLGSRTGGIPELLESDCLFSNRRNNHVEIAESILRHLNNMSEYARRNYNASLDYRNDLIQERRESMLKLFCEKEFGQ